MKMPGSNCANTDDCSDVGISIFNAGTRQIATTSESICDLFGMVPNARKTISNPYIDQNVEVPGCN